MAAISMSNRNHPVNQTDFLEDFHQYKIEHIFRDTPATDIIMYSWNMPLICAACYLVFVFAGRKWMENRKAFDLRWFMIGWSIFLAIFSFFGLRFPLYLFKYYWKQGDFKAVVCWSGNRANMPILEFWTKLFALSKFVEYVDTVLIVLRKQNLSFLHWYHHLTVSLFTWEYVKETLAGGTVYCSMNFFVHFVMYTYYAFRAARYRPPRFVALTITSLQIIQMILGMITVGVVAVWRGEGCKMSTEHLIYAIFVYLSYFVLFLNFFYQTYILKHRPSKKKAIKVESDHTAKTNGTDITIQSNGTHMHHESNGNDVVRQRTKQPSNGNA